MYQSIGYRVDKSAAVITLNRPEALNALTYTMIDELKHALATAEADRDVVGIILTGEGRGFCSGMDMSTLESTSSSGEMDEVEESQNLAVEPGDNSMGENFSNGYAYLMTLRKPVIAAVNGAAAGMGMSIALFCDMRFASTKALFVTSFAHRGLIAEHGQSWLLPRIVGPSKALDLFWSSRKVRAEEALEIGLIDRLYEPEELVPAAIEYVEQLGLYSSPTSMMLIKQQVYQHMHLPLGEAMKASDALMIDCIKRDDYKEGVASFVEKRAPNFKRIGE